MNKAAIDIGSNTILLLIMDESHNQLEFEARVTSLGKKLDETNMFQESSMQASYEALLEYSEICKRYGIKFSDVAITATEASRVASNASTFFDKVHQELDTNISIISGEKEAYYAAYGVVKGEGVIDKQQITLMDIGGGSTELINVQVEPFKIVKTISLPLGSVRVSDWLEKGLWGQKKAEFVEKYSFSEYSCEKLIGVAGTMTSLINMAKNNQDNFEFINFMDSQIQTKKLNKIMGEFESFSPNDFEERFPYLGKRSSAIWGGYQVCKFICEQIKPESIQVSFKGLVHGVLLSSGSDS